MALATRLFLLVLLAAYAVTAWGSGVDRFAGKVPAAAPAVPGLFANEAARTRAMVALARDDFETARAQSRIALIKGPLDPASAGLWGGALLGAGEAQEADRAFRISGQLGWRDPYTQSYWLQVAIATGDTDIAAQRFDALMRQDPAGTGVYELTGLLELDEAGQQALAKRLEERPIWEEAYFSPNQEIPSAQFVGRAQVLSLLAQAGVADCGLAGRFASRLIARQEFTQARSIWVEACPEASTSLLVNGSFDSLASGSTSPFDWAEFSDGSLKIRRLMGEDRGLEATSTAPIARRLVRQLLVIEPGPYRLSWSATGPSGEPTDRVFASTGCGPETADRIPAERAGDRFVASIRVPAQCKAFYVAFSLRAGSGAVEINDVVLDPAN